MITLIALAVALLHRPTAKPADTSNAGLYQARPGYSHDDGVGDPGALQTDLGPVISYGGQPVVQACGVLSPTDITALGLRLDNSPLTSTIQRTFFDGSGQGTVVTGDSSSLPRDEDANSCTYRFDSSDRDLVSLAVYQPSYANTSAFNAEQNRHYTAQPDQPGVHIYLANPTGQAALDAKATTYLLRGTVANAQLLIITTNTAERTRILARVAANLAKTQTTPTGLPEFSLRSPIFTGGPILAACSLLTNDVYRAAFNVDASPLVQENAASAIGVIDDGPSSSHAPRRYNYADSDCVRHNSARTKLEAVNLRVVTTTYETATDAQAAMKFKRDESPFTSGVQSTPTTLGDESFYASKLAEADHALAFRKGRVIVVATFSLPQNNSAVSDAGRLHVLMAAAQVMINEHLKNF
ncbi:MAG TPA: hypothetical protein VLI05_06305 [Candidatus Saccharimonadia bacterium]|nr:hypothetical protein [Candidatus Saccharimonadia bacterium]